MLRESQPLGNSNGNVVSTTTMTTTTTTTTTITKESVCVQDEAKAKGQGGHSLGRPVVCLFVCLFAGLFVKGVDPLRRGADWRGERRFVGRFEEKTDTHQGPSLIEASRVLIAARPESTP